MRKVCFMSLIVITVLVAALALVFAEEKFGIKVYDGAKFDADTTKFLKESMSLEAACYTTNDSVDKVVAFYKKQPGLKSVGISKESAMFKKGNIDVTMQSPWMDMKTGKMMKSTLISIVKSPFNM